jgi:DegV family protein with EDD domain
VIHVVTDSTSDITPSEAHTMGVTLVPLFVRFGQDQYRDGIDLDADAFYSLLQHNQTHPSTSQPTPEQFSEVYERLLRDPGDEVVSLHISAGLSGTLQSATLAAKDFDAERLHLVDTQTVSAGLMLLVRAALQDIAGGNDARTVASLALARRSKVSILLLLDTLTYLQRGGRIGRAQALVGSLLNVKPLLTMKAGEVAPLARVRSQRQGIDKIAELLKARVPLRSVAVFHARVPELVGALRERVHAEVGDVDMVGGRIGPVVGAYTGPGGIGVASLGAD